MDTCKKMCVVQQIISFKAFKQIPKLVSIQDLPFESGVPCTSYGVIML